MVEAMATMEIDFERRVQPFWQAILNRLAILGLLLTPTIVTAADFEPRIAVYDESSTLWCTSALCTPDAVIAPHSTMNKQPRNPCVSTPVEGVMVVVPAATVVSCRMTFVFLPRFIFELLSSNSIRP